MISPSLKSVALKNAGAIVELYRRNKHELQEACEQLQMQPACHHEQGGYDIVINCTGVGMHDTVGKSPVVKSVFQNATWAIDLIYEPDKSEFLRLAEESGVNILNGKAMLFYQAYYADCLYLDKTPSVEEATSLYKAYLLKE